MRILRKYKTGNAVAVETWLQKQESRTDFEVVESSCSFLKKGTFRGWVKGYKIFNTIGFLNKHNK